jgi:hypothetical protein
MEIVGIWNAVIEEATVIPALVLNSLALFWHVKHLPKGTLQIVNRKSTAFVRQISKFDSNSKTVYLHQFFRRVLKHYL